MNLAAYTRWYRKATPAKDLVPILRFLDDHTFATKQRNNARGYGICLRLRGIDGECLDRWQMDSISTRLNASLRQLQGIRLFQYVVKREGFPIPEKPAYVSTAATNYVRQRNAFLRNTGKFYRVELVWCLYIASKKNNLTPDAYSKDLNEILQRLKKTALQLKGELDGDFSPEILTAEEVFRFYSYLLCLEEHMMPRMRSPHGLDRQMVSTAIRWDSNGFRIGKRSAQMFSLIQRPAGTRPNLFGELLNLDSEFVMCIEWEPKTVQITNKAVQKQEGYKAFTTHRLMAVLSHMKQRLPRTARSVAASRGTTDLGGVVYDIESGARQYGQFSLIGMIHSRDRQAVADVMPLCHRIFGTTKAQIIEEDEGAMCAYYSLFPGNEMNVRKAWLQDLNCADLALAYAPNTGHERSEALEDECLAIFQTRGNYPYLFDPYFEGVRGLLGIGSPGRGKSVHGNFFVDNEQKYGGFTYIFDIGNSYDHTLQRYGGRVTRFGLDGPRLNPFSLEPTESNIQFVFRFVRLLIKKSGAALAAVDEENLELKVRQVFHLDRSLRRLRHLVVAPHLRPYLTKWVEGGIYGNVFDNVEDSLEMNRIQCFDFQDIGEDFQDLMEPLLFWIVRRINTVLHAPENIGIPKHLLFDEVWKHLKDPQMLDVIIGTAKTARKHLGGITLLTHAIDDLGDHAQLIRNTCPMTLFLGDPSLDPQVYKREFKLNDKEVEQIASLRIGESLLKRPDYSRVLVLNLDTESLVRYSTRPKDVKRRAEAIARYGEGAYAALAGGKTA